MVQQTEEREQNQTTVVNREGVLRQSTLDAFTSRDATIAAAVAEEARRGARMEAETARRVGMDSSREERSI